MKIKISTPVKAGFDETVSNFNEKLFLRLSPLYPKINLIRFDGCKVGDRVELELNFGFYKMKWVSKIVESLVDDHRFQFIDEGIILPFFLTSWTHKHIVVRKDESCFIVDDIEYGTGYFILDAIIFPLMYMQFYGRRSVYKKYFRTLSN